MLLLLFAVAASGGDIIGTGSIAEGNDTVAATAEARAQAAGTITDGPDTVGATSVVRLSGAGSVADSADSPVGTATARLSASGTISEGGDVAGSSGSARLSGAGTVTDPDVAPSGLATVRLSGSGAGTDGADTAAGSGALLADTQGQGFVIDTGEALLSTMVVESEVPAMSYLTREEQPVLADDVPPGFDNTFFDPESFHTGGYFEREATPPLAEFQE